MAPPATIHACSACTYTPTLSGATHICLHVQVMKANMHQEHQRSVMQSLLQQSELQLRQEMLREIVKALHKQLCGELLGYLLTWRVNYRCALEDFTRRAIMKYQASAGNGAVVSVWGAARARALSDAAKDNSSIEGFVHGDGQPEPASEADNSRSAWDTLIPRPEGAVECREPRGRSRQRGSRPGSRESSRDSDRSKGSGLSQTARKPRSGLPPKAPFGSSVPRF